MSTPVLVLPAPAQVLNRLRPWTEVIVVYLMLAALIVDGATRSPVFHTPQNAENVLRQSIVLGLVGIGQTFVLISGGIDMSVGSIVKLTGLVGAIVMNGQDSMIGPALLIALGIGAAVGLLNGLLVTQLRAAPFIVTFAVFYVVRGIAFTISTQPVGLTPPGLSALYDASWLGIPLAIAGMAVVWVLAWFALRRTQFGRHVYAVGGREDVAILSGIHVRWLRVIVYVISGLCAALAGLFTLVIGGVGDPQAGDNLEFLSITAAVIGGVSLFGGKGALAGTLGGILLLTLIGNVFQITEVNSFYQQPLLGLIILLAVALYRRRRQGQ